MRDTLPESASGAALPIWRLDLRPLGYRRAWGIQRELVARRQRGEIPDVLWITEHPPVFTLGRTARPEHLLRPAGRLRREGAEVIETDRGGDVTFHGPGQLVAYPIFDLALWRKDVHAYLRGLEAVVIEAVSGLGVPARRREGFTGVWCGGEAAPRKLASIGVRVSRWVASHGLALNVATDLEWFSYIVPCGIRDSEPTALAAEVGRPVGFELAADRIAEAFGSVFGRGVRPAPPDLAAALTRRAGAARPAA